MAALALFALAVIVAGHLGATAPPGIPLASGVSGTVPPPPSGEPEVRVAVAGDTGTADAAERRTADAIDSLEAAREFDALLLLGDLIYETGDPVDPAFVDLLGYPDRLELRAVDQDGRLVDAATITRPPGAELARPR